jgi:uncharacterized protein YutE (UPF0331/DUF86 family)
MSPGRVDLAVVRRHLMALDGFLAALRRHQGVTAADLASDRERLWAVERGLQLCAQNSLDLATHLAVAAGRDVPDYASAIDRLAELGVLPPELATRFRAVAGFRNVLVHGYLEVDVDLVARVLAERLDDFAAFAERVDAYARRVAGT